MQKTILVAAAFSKELDSKARVVAATQRISKSELLRRAVEEYIERCAYTANKAESERERC